MQETKDTDTFLQEIFAAQKMKFSINDYFGNYGRNCEFWSHLLKKPLMENFFFSAVIDDLKIQ